MSEDTPIYFYPLAYLRDRQLDTIRHWPRRQVLNPEIAENRRGAQVSRSAALSKAVKISWKQKLPLVNIKLRPKGLPPGTVVYSWGAVIATGPFILELDNPYALTGYNFRAMALYRPLLKRVLSGPRCREIRCLSDACRQNLRLLFGDDVYRRATVHYPLVDQQLQTVPVRHNDTCRFLFVGTQFEIKGGRPFLRAFERLHQEIPRVHLDLITHLPEEFRAAVQHCPGITLHTPPIPREEIFRRFMATSDVFVFPSYIESFGVVVLEALAHGLALIASDVYAIPEMVENGRNGFLLHPPISAWDGVLPSRYQYQWPRFKDFAIEANDRAFEEDLFNKMRCLAVDSELLNTMRRNSLDMFRERFSRRA